MHCSNEVTVKPVFTCSLFLFCSAMFLTQCWHNLSILMIHNAAAWRVFFFFFLVETFGLIFSLLSHEPNFLKLLLNLPFICGKRLMYAYLFPAEVLLRMQTRISFALGNLVYLLHYIKEIMHLKHNLSRKRQVTRCM